MALTKWKELPQEILDGKHDDELDQIDSAVKWRKKQMFRPGSQYKLVGTKNTNLEGKIATVLRVNAKRIAVGVGEQTEEYGYKSWSDGEYNVPAGMLAPLS